MNAKDNKRLKEIRLSLYLSKIDNVCKFDDYTKAMQLLNCLAGVIDSKESSAFTKFIMASVGNNVLGATDKEIVATIITFFTKTRAFKMLGISYATLYNRYGDLFDRDFITEDFLNSLTPMFEEDNQFIGILTDFIENFKWEIGYTPNKFLLDERTLEIEFWLIYDRIMRIYHNDYFCRNFMYAVCLMFNIDTSIIMNLYNNLHNISRAYPLSRYNRRYFMQEIVYLYSKKGLSKGQISRNVLNKGANYLYNGSNKKFCDLIENEDNTWSYASTLDWSRLDKEEVRKFIDIFHSFIKYGI